MNDNDQVLDDYDPSDRSTGGAHAVAGGATGLPVRGLAMVLIAIAILFGLWGLYSLTQGSPNATPDNTAAAGSASTSVSPAPAGDAASATKPSADASATSTSGKPDADGKDAEGSTNAPAPAAQPAPAASGPTEINILNNSTVSGLAEQTHQHFYASGKKVGQHGNLPEQAAKLQRNTVFYQPGDAAGEQAARDLVAELKNTYGVDAVAEPNIDQLPGDFRGNGEITLALIGALNF
ncbi:LytR cell envelope-related transcriptional attenuator [Corynebacterium uterequi]|uniref:LytR cell envelope-related transcriptional attenuator n=1 Tax=Corynebacterium uterequi TaxID=1072256 RepID=A0A0G3HIY2_9CORY|nr:LytR cell envelope-related transcriptional attenuator [Corynebacterium uterequi]